MSIRNLINIPGLNIAVNTDREQFVEGAACAVAKRAYIGTRAIAGKTFDDTAKVVETGDRAALKTQQIISVTSAAADSLITNAIASTTKTGQRIYKATKVKAKAEATQRLAPATDKIIAIKKTAVSLKEAAAEAIDTYCDDAPPIALLEASVSVPTTPTAPRRRRARKVAIGN